MAAVQVDNLTFSYSRRGTNLENINILVPRGTIYGLLGPSGCCKTTLLRCIVGLLKPRVGTVNVFGYQPGTKECGIPGPNIGYMPQEISLISQFTVRETLEYYAGFARPAPTSSADHNSLDSRIAFLLKLLDISEFEHVYTDRLSGGQQRRVSLAVAMINDPPLLILDEPTVGVDPIVREAIWSYLVDQSKNGLTVIVTTHYIEEAGSADKVGFMRQGRILAEGNPSVLMYQHSVSTMERLFLKLSQQDDVQSRHSEFPNDLLLQMSATGESGVQVETPFATRKQNESAVCFSNGSASLLMSTNTSNKKQNLMISNESYKRIDHDLVVSTTTTSPTISPVPSPDSGTNSPILNNNNSSYNNNNNNNSHYNNNHCCQVNMSQSKSSSQQVVTNSTKNVSSQTSFKNKNSSSSSPPSTESYIPVTKSKASRTYSVHGQNRSVNSYQKIGVLCRKHRLRLFRRVPELVITMLLPALEVALFCLCMGRDPTSVQMAVCNMEKPPFLSLMFLKSIDSDFIALKYYKTPEDAINSVREADTYSAIILSQNFSTSIKQFGGPMVSQQVQTLAATMSTPKLQSFTSPMPSMVDGDDSGGASASPLMASTSGNIRSLQTPNTGLPALPMPTATSATPSLISSTEITPNGDLLKSNSSMTTTMMPNSQFRAATMDPLLDANDSSIIKIYYDGSNALHVNIIRREVFSALFRFVETAGKTLGGEIAGYQLPIKFEKPIYGTEKTDMIEFVGPGLMVFIVFFATMSITSMAFLSERREGTLERSLIVGMTPTEFIISQIINITFLLIVQITLTVVMGFWIFDFPMKGSYVLAVLMMFLQGLCGMTYGLMLSAICTNEMAALMLGAGSQLMFCFITGIFWPVDTMIPLLRYISYAMPQTKPMESFRHILIRGFDLSKPAVLNGYFITVAWIGFFLVLAIVIFRIR